MVNDTGVTRPGTVTFQADPGLHAALEKVADDEGCSTSDVVRHALNDLFAARAPDAGIEPLDDGSAEPLDEFRIIWPDGTEEVHPLSSAKTDLSPPETDSAAESAGADRPNVRFGR